MNKTKSVVFILQAEDQNQLHNIFSKANIEVGVSDQRMPTNLLGFDAEGVRSLIVAIGGTGIITAISQILVTYLKERKKTIAIRKKDGDLEIIANNYNAKELESVLQNLNETDTIWLINRHIEIRREITEILVDN